MKNIATMKKTVFITLLIVAGLALSGCIDLPLEAIESEGNANLVWRYPCDNGTIVDDPSACPGAGSSGLNEPPSSGDELQTDYAEFCEGMQTNFHAEACYSDYAILADDLDLCTSKGGIYADVCSGVLSGNCDSIQAVSLKDYCNFELAIKTDSEDVCSLISIEAYKDACNFALSNDPASCANIYLDTCYYSVAIFTNNSSFCSNTKQAASNYYLEDLCLFLIKE